MNKNTVIEILKKESIFSEIEGADTFVEYLVGELKHISLCSVYSTQARIAVRIDNGEHTIIWDECYWKYYRKYLMAAETARKYKMAVTQAVTAVIAEHLSERFSAFKDLREFLEKIALQFGIAPNLTEEETNKMELRIFLAKIFSVFHEMAHIRIAQKDTSALNTKNIIFRMLSNLEKEHFESLGEWAELHFHMVQDILEGKYEEILEELMADAYAAGKIAVYLKDIFGYLNFALICEAVASIGCLSGFQNLFNVITRTWDGHYTEIRFGLDPRPRENDPYINELEVVRNGLGQIITVTLLLSRFELSNRQRQEIWRYHDKEHVKTSAVMDCLSSEEFICTAIHEARESF